MPVRQGLWRESGRLISLAEVHLADQTCSKCGFLLAYGVASRTRASIEASNRYGLEKE